jgi:Bacterial extracellular solute-binding proteins, family 3
MDLRVKWVDTSVDTLFTQVAAGRFEMAAAAPTITPERERQVTSPSPITRHSRRLWRTRSAQRTFDRWQVCRPATWSRCRRAPPVNHVPATACRPASRFGPSPRRPTSDMACACSSLGRIRGRLAGGVIAEQATRAPARSATRGQTEMRGSGWPQDRVRRGGRRLERASPDGGRRVAHRCSAVPLARGPEPGSPAQRAAPGVRAAGPPADPAVPRPGAPRHDAAGRCD